MSQKRLTVKELEQLEKTSGENENGVESYSGPCARVKYCPVKHRVCITDASSSHGGGRGLILLYCPQIGYLPLLYFGNNSGLAEAHAVSRIGCSKRRTLI